MNIAEKSKFKLLIIYQYFGTPKGGWSTRVYEFARRWVANGHQVTVITSPYYKSDIKPNGLISKQNIEGIELIVLNFPDSNKQGVFARAYNALCFAFFSCFFALTLPYQLVLGSSGPITVGIPALLAKWIRRKKFIFEVRDLWPRGGIELGKITNKWVIKAGLWFEKLLYSSADLVVACSEGMETGVKAVYSAVPTLIIPNSSDTDLFSNETQINKKSNRTVPLLIYIGSLGYMDDCIQIIRGLEKAKELPFEMIFLGDGEEKELLCKEVTRLGIEDKVKFFGLVPKLEVVTWLRMATASFVTFRDVSVLHTNSPNKMFDSFAAGVPIIQSTKGWIKDLIDRYQAGWNVDPQSPQSFANVIEEIVSNPDLVKKKGANAYLLAKGEFDRTALSEKYEIALKELI